MVNQVLTGREESVSAALSGFSSQSFSTEASEQFALDRQSNLAWEYSAIEYSASALIENATALICRLRGLSGCRTPAINSQQL